MTLTKTQATRKAKPLRLIYFFIGIGLGTGFGLYLWNLYGQLTQAFVLQDQFVPTRIYSDVSRISNPQLRSQVESRLHNLGYSWTSKKSSIEFTLHKIEYPGYLLPDNHPILNSEEQAATISFDRGGPSGIVQTLALGDKSVPDLFLEPELVATLSRNGEAKREIRTYLKFEEIPASLWKAIISIEDQHFLDHRGLDPKGLARAIWVNLKTFSLAQGGSTITQQLVKNLMARRTKNIFRKVNELFLALLLEAKFEKEDILERYLNEVYLGQVGSLEVHGVAEGAQHFFGKRVEELNLAEMALMAGLIRGPGFYSPYRNRDRALERQRLVIRKMVETKQIAEAEAENALQLPIRLAPPQNSSNKAPFFTDYVKAELVRALKDRMPESDVNQAGFRVYTTLNSSLNAEAQKAISEGIIQLETRLKLKPEDRLEGALASVDQKTGNILALIGGRSYSQSNFNRILNMKRQVGSTFKPIVYLTAFQKGENSKGIPYGPAYPTEDAPWSLIFDHGRQKWTPRNYEKGNQGWMPLRTALSHSVNTVASKLGYEVGIENVVKVARSLGIESDLPAVPSLSLGVAELSPIELLRVYATLANHGFHQDLNAIRSIVQTDGTLVKKFVSNPIPVFETGPVDLLTDILQSVFIDGTARSAKRLGFENPAAGKTGTTSNYRDAWFAGYTPSLTTVVWVGMDQQSSKIPSKSGLTGASSALPIWVSYMRAAIKGEPTVEFPASSSLVEVRVDKHTGQLALPDCPSEQTLTEKYMKGHEPKEQSCQPEWPPSAPQTLNAEN